VLTGIHLGGYGKDLTPALTLADLVEMIAEAAPLPRIRLSSIDPPEITPRLLDLVARSRVLCPHFHVPVQAAADGVLRRMRRLYDSTMVREVAAEIGRVLPHAALGTDVIAGFPGESAADFDSGLALLEEARFSYFHVFPYSRRSGTSAAKATDHLPPQTIRARAQALRRLGAEKRRAFAQRCIGAELEVLVESTRDRETGRLAGYGRNYARVLLDGGDALVNTEVRVRAVAQRGERLLGIAVAR
jgi:threonylcarbamoyladenosine tRNA methylthiotransferase MtaB